MRIVLDTNVLVSALINDSGAPAQVVDLCIAGDLELAVDARILSEYRNVLCRPELGLDAADVDALLDLAVHAEHVVAVPLPLSLPDADDMPFLEVAVAAAADALVTGNAKHFVSQQGRVDVPILSPRALLDRLGLAGR
jgi:putative PIN family toxin of toxin-antitoxin system